MQQVTCGAGIAEYAAVPGKLGHWSAAMADVLEAHTAALDSEDPVARVEVDAYVRLANRFRELAAELRATAPTATSRQQITTKRCCEVIARAMRFASSSNASASIAARGMGERSRQPAYDREAHSFPQSYCTVICCHDEVELHGAIAARPSSFDRVLAHRSRDPRRVARVAVR